MRTLRAGAPAQRAAAPPVTVRSAALRFKSLYQISQALTRCSGVDECVPVVLSVVTRLLPLSVVTMVLDDGRSIAWHGAGVSDAWVLESRTQAERAYVYLTRSAAPGSYVRDTSVLPALQAAPETHEPRRILLPLVSSGARIFGVLQFVSTARLDESDLEFINITVNQLAVALDRAAAVQARQAEVETRRVVAEAAALQARSNEAEALALEELARERFEFNLAVTGSIDEGVVAVDPNERVTFINHAAARLLRCSEPEALGKPFGDMLAIEGYEPAAGEAESAPFARVMATGVRHRSDSRLFRPRTGPAFPVSYTCAPIRRRGQITGAVLVFEDILELRRSEQLQRFLSETSATLASSLDYRATLASVVRSAVPLLADLCLIDELGEDGRVQRLEVVFADPAKSALSERVRGFAPGLDWQTPQAVVLRGGRTLLLADARPDRMAHDAAHAELLAEIGVRSLIVVPLRARGRTFGALTLVTAESGRCYGEDDLPLAEEMARRAAVAVDNARLYEQAQRASEARQQLLAIVSHDLRSPLSTILMTSNLLLNPRRGPNRRVESRRVLETIHRAAEWMNRMLGDLIQVGSIETGTLKVEVRTLSAVTLLEEAAELNRPAAAEKALCFEVDLPPPALEVCCDRERMLQVLGNLLGNAIKFTAAGSIRLRAEQRGHEVLFSVTDTGPGIVAEDLPLVFDRYWQAPKTARLGTGLGLSIAKALVSLQGGCIWVESEVGVGSRFFFTLPMAAVDREAPSDSNVR